MMLPPRLLFLKVENEILDFKFFTVLLKFVTEVKEEISTLVICEVISSV